MADIAITTTQVVQSTDATAIEHGVSGEAITIGQSVYRKASDGKIYKAKDATAAEATAKGIATSSAVATGQAVSYQKAKTLTLGAGAAITAGAIYVVSDTYGGICLESEIGAGDYVCILGVGNSSNGIVIPDSGPFYSGVAHA
jgi:outer membrane protein assembly factor BamB